MNNRVNYQPTQKAIYFWNTLGGLLNAGFSVVIMIIWQEFIRQEFFL